jgi:hypothetical protein
MELHSTGDALVVNNASAGFFGDMTQGGYNSPLVRHLIARGLIVIGLDSQAQFFSEFSNISAREIVIGSLAGSNSNTAFGNCIIDTEEDFIVGNAGVGNCQTFNLQLNVGGRLLLGADGGFGNCDVTASDINITGGVGGTSCLIRTGCRFAASGGSTIDTPNLVVDPGGLLDLSQSNLNINPRTVDDKLEVNGEAYVINSRVQTPQIAVGPGPAPYGILVVANGSTVSGNAPDSVILNQGEVFIEFSSEISGMSLDNLPGAIFSLFDSIWNPGVIPLPTSPRIVNGGTLTATNSNFNGIDLSNQIAGDVIITGGSFSSDDGIEIDNTGGSVTFDSVTISNTADDGILVAPPSRAPLAPGLSRMTAGPSILTTCQPSTGSVSTTPPVPSLSRGRPSRIVMVG